MLSIETSKRIIRILASPIPVRSWRRALRSFLIRKAALLDSREFAYFKKQMCIYGRTPATFSFKDEANPLVSIVIPVFNQYRYTQLCLWAILQNTGAVPYEIILADDCSTDKTRTISERIKGIKIIKTKSNSGFLRNCNNAANHARGKYILFLNNDTQVQPGWLRSLIDLMEKDANTGLVGSKLIYPNGILQEAGGIVYKDGSACNYGRNDLPTKDQYCYVKEVDYISGACIMIRRTLWNRIGGFDERYSPAYYEDTDLAFQVRQCGFKVVYQPASKVVHFEGKSNGTDIHSGLKSNQVLNQKKFFDKWHDVLQKQHGTHKDIFLACDRALGKKTLLFIDRNVLDFDTNAGDRSSFHYLKFFVKHGLNVKFLPLRNSPRDYHLDAIRQIGVEVVNLVDNPTIELGKWLEQNRDYIDYVYLNRPNVATIVFDSLKKCSSAKIIYQGHDLHFARLRRQYECTKELDFLRKSEHFERIEKELIPKMDVVTFFSDEEVAEVKGWGVENTVAAIPLFLFDIDGKREVEHRYSAVERSGIMFVGGFRHLPNVDAAMFLVKEIMPIAWKHNPEIQVHIVGANPPEEVLSLATERIAIHGFVSDDELNRLYSQIKISVVPLRFGAGVKGKVLESLYYGVPVVTTRVGVQGIPECTCIATGRTADEIAGKIIDLYNNGIALDKMSRDANTFIQVNYSEQAALDRFCQWMEIQ